MLSRIIHHLRAPDETGGGTPNENQNVADQTESNGPESHEDPAPPTGTERPLNTEAVVNGKSEREAALEAQLEAERNERRQREVRINELEDENFQLKTADKPTPMPPKKKKSGGVMSSFFGYED